MDDLVTTEQVTPDSDIGTPDVDLGTDDSYESTAETVDSTPDPVSSLADVPEQYRGLVEAKLKNLEAGYTQKYQTLAEERKMLERMAEVYQNASRTTTGNDEQTPTSIDPFTNADWDSGWTEDGRPINQVMYEQIKGTFGQLAEFLESKFGSLAAIESEFTTQQKARQMETLHKEYGDFDEGALLEAQKANPSIPLDYLAAKMLQDTVKERAKAEAYSNKAVKREATQVASSTASTMPDRGSMKNWDMLDFFKHAKNGGSRL